MQGNQSPVFSPPSPLLTDTPRTLPSGRAKASGFWPRAVGVAGICVFLAGAGTSQRVHPRQLAPQTQIEVQALEGVRSDCQPGADVRVERGQMPPQARITHQVLWQADSALPIAYAEKELSAEARRRCGDGITLQNAIADEGANGVIEVRAVIWVLPQASPP